MVRSTMRVQVAARRIFHQDLHQEAVELRLGQRIGSFHLDRILRGHHQKWRFQMCVGVPLVTVCSCMASSSARLRFGRGAINFVGQNQVAQKSAPAEIAGPCARSQYR